MKNAGENSVERWYLQLEWLPELGMAGGWKSISGTLTDAIVSAEIDANVAGKDLDAVQQDRLQIYWSEYGE